MGPSQLHTAVCVSPRLLLRLLLQDWPSFVIRLRYTFHVIPGRLTCRARHQDQLSYQVTSKLNKTSCFSPNLLPTLFSRLTVVRRLLTVSVPRQSLTAHLKSTAVLTLFFSLSIQYSILRLATSAFECSFFVIDQFSSFTCTVPSASP